MLQYVMAKKQARNKQNSCHYQLITALKDPVKFFEYFNKIGSPFDFKKIYGWSALSCGSFVFDFTMGYD